MAMNLSVGGSIESDTHFEVGQERIVASIRQSLWVLAVAAILLLLANGRNTVPIAAWFAPLFLLRFVRARGKWLGLSIGWLVLSGVWTFQFRGMAPLPTVAFLILAAAFGLVQLLPLALDRFLTTRMAGFTGTLPLPLAWVVTEYVVSEFTPYGSWGSWAYTQHENLLLLQITSVTGPYGISFLIAWFATVGNWAWEHQFAWPKVRSGVLTFSVAMAAVLLIGGARLAFHLSDVPTVRVASLTRPDIDLFTDPALAQQAYAGTLSEEGIEQIRERAKEINENLFQRSEKEARAGAKIVFWGEANAFAFKKDEPALIRRGAELARSHQIYLGISVGTWNQDSPKPFENKIVLIDPKGEVVLNTLKARPVPGGEAAISARDDGRIKSVATPYGRIGAAICFDMDFPGLIAEAGRQRVDVMLVPSNDWRAIDPWHTHMARLRAVEQGFNLVRHVSGGLSLATDYHGRTLASMDHYTTKHRALIAHVPTRGVQTLYSRIGDTFAWLCLAGLLISVVSSRTSRGSDLASTHLAAVDSGA